MLGGAYAPPIVPGAPAEQPQLRVTRRCLLEDFDGFDEDDVERPIEELLGRNEMVDRFYERRRTSPEGQEIVTDLTSKIVAWTLHSGEDRGVTWHQERGGVVWLLAVGFHRSGQRDDAYPYFRRLDARERLLPTEEDYRALARVRQGTLARALAEEVPPLLELAAANPGEIQQALIGGRIAVRVVREDGDTPLTTVAISRRARPGTMPLQPAWEFAVAAAFLPNSPVEDLSLAGDIAGQELAADETAYCDFA